jgi:hypothetical protein
VVEAGTLDDEDDVTEDDVVETGALVDDDDEELVMLVVLEVTVEQSFGGEISFKEFLIVSKYGVPHSQSFRALVASQSITPPN